MSSSPGDIFLARCDTDGADTTLESSVSISDLDELPDKLSSEEQYRIWGVSDDGNNRSNFEKLSAGDLILFYRDGEYIGTGYIGTAFEDPDGALSSAFWDEEPITLVYTVEDFESVSVPKAAVNRIFDYDESYTPRELFRVASSRVSHDPAAIKLAISQFD